MQAWITVGIAVFTLLLSLPRICREWKPVAEWFVAWLWKPVIELFVTCFKKWMEQRRKQQL